MRSWMSIAVSLVLVGCAGKGQSAEPREPASSRSARPVEGDAAAVTALLDRFRGAKNAPAELLADHVVLESCNKPARTLGRAELATWIDDTQVMFPTKESCTNNCCTLAYGDNESTPDIGQVVRRVCLADGHVTELHTACSEM